MNSFEHLQNLAKAGANILHLSSFEWERVRGHVIGLGNTLRLSIHVWSQSTGLHTCSDQGQLNVEDEAATDPLELLKAIHGGSEPGIWLLEDFHPFLREEHHSLLRWLRELARMPAYPRKLVVLSTPLPGLPWRARCCRAVLRVAAAWASACACSAVT